MEWWVWRGSGEEVSKSLLVKIVLTVRFDSIPRDISRLPPYNLVRFEYENLTNCNR